MRKSKIPVPTSRAAAPHPPSEELLDRVLVAADALHSRIEKLSSLKNFKKRPPTPIPAVPSVPVAPIPPARTVQEAETQEYDVSLDEHTVLKSLERIMDSRGFQQTSLAVATEPLTSPSKVDASSQVDSAPPEMPVLPSVSPVKKMDKDMISDLPNYTRSAVSLIEASSTSRRKQREIILALKEQTIEAQAQAEIEHLRRVRYLTTDQVAMDHSTERERALMMKLAAEKAEIQLSRRQLREESMKRKKMDLRKRIEAVYADARRDSDCDNVELDLKRANLSMSPQKKSRSIEDRSLVILETKLKELKSRANDKSMYQRERKLEMTKQIAAELLEKRRRKLNWEQKLKEEISKVNSVLDDALRDDGIRTPTPEFDFGIASRGGDPMPTYRLDSLPASQPLDDVLIPYAPTDKPVVVHQPKVDDDDGSLLKTISTAANDLINKIESLKRQVETARNKSLSVEERRVARASFNTQLVDTAKKELTDSLNAMMESQNDKEKDLFHPVIAKLEKKREGDLTSSPPKPVLIINERETTFSLEELQERERLQQVESVYSKPGAFEALIVPAKPPSAPPSASSQKTLKPAIPFESVVDQISDSLMADLMNEVFESFQTHTKAAFTTIEEVFSPEAVDQIVDIAAESRSLNNQLTVGQLATNFDKFYEDSNITDLIADSVNEAILAVGTIRHSSDIWKNQVRQIYTKWINARSIEKEKLEHILQEEIRDEEKMWLDSLDFEGNVKDRVADMIFDDLITGICNSSIFAAVGK